MDTVTLKQIVPKIGRILKVFREKTGKNQGDVATEAGISVSMLSQIERGQVSASIETLVAVCAAVGMEPSELFKLVTGDKPVRIHKSGERLKTEVGGIRYEQLMTSNHGTYQAEMFLLDVLPGCKTALSSDGHDGVEMGFVLKGIAELTVDNVVYSVKEGDSIWFNSNRPHQLFNNGKDLFRAVWSISPPHVDYLGSADAERSDLPQEHLQ
jgi:transcriptional regulator with XRE-family HTH domain